MEHLEGFASNLFNLELFEGTTYVCVGAGMDKGDILSEIFRNYDPTTGAGGLESCFLQMFSNGRLPLRFAKEVPSDFRELRGCKVACHFDSVITLETWIGQLGSIREFHKTRASTLLEELQPRLNQERHALVQAMEHFQCLTPSTSNAWLKGVISMAIEDLDNFTTGASTCVHLDTLRVVCFSRDYLLFAEDRMLRKENWMFLRGNSLPNIYQATPVFTCGKFSMNELKQLLGTSAAIVLHENDFQPMMLDAQEEQRIVEKAVKNFASRMVMISEAYLPHLIQRGIDEQKAREYFYRETEIICLYEDHDS